MSQVQPITIEEQDAFLKTGKVPTKIDTKVPLKYRQAERLSRAAIDKTLASFGKPENLPGFKFKVGTVVYTTNGTTPWTVVAQADTPAGTSPKSYRCVAGKMERIFGEYALHNVVLVPPTTSRRVIDVRLNQATGEIEPTDPATIAARQELKSQLEATAARDRAPNVTLVTDPALYTVEPTTARFTQVVSWKTANERSATKPAPTAKIPATRLNAPFASTSVITVLSVTNPKKPGSKSYDRFACYANGQTIEQAIAAGVTMADVKWDAAHRFIKVAAV